MVGIDDGKPQHAERLAAAPEWEAQFCAAVKALRERIDQTHLFDSDLFAAADHLRSLWLAHHTSAGPFSFFDEPTQRQSWLALKELYARLAQCVPARSGFRRWLALAVQRTAWCLAWAFHARWRLPAQPPSSLWQALYQTWRLAANRQVLWHRVSEPLCRDGKQSAHETVASVLLLQLLDPSRLAREELTAMRSLAEHYAIFLQIVPPAWVNGAEEYYAIVFEQGLAPRPRAVLGQTETQPWLLDTGALANRLLTDLGKLAAKDDPEAREQSHNLKQVLNAWTRRPPQRRTPRHRVIATLYCHSGWNAIYPLFAGHPFHSPTAENLADGATLSHGGMTRGNDVKSFDPIQTSASGPAPPATNPLPSVWQQLDGTPSGCMAMAPMPIEAALRWEPGILLAIQWRRDQAPTAPRLARLRWRQYVDADEMRIGIEFFPFARVDAAALKAQVRAGEPQASWLPALVAASTRDPQRLAVIAPREALQHLWRWELCWHHHHQRLLEYDDLVEEGRDYVWLVCRIGD